MEDGKLNFEINFHLVGDASRADDAVSVRYGTEGSYKVLIIEGGTDDSAEDVVRHVKSLYGDHTIVSDVISTHPDSDHACGLREILRELPVERLWAHGLWHHAAEIIDLFEDSRWSVQGLADAIKVQYPAIAELFELAAQEGIPICEPFTGTRIGPFTVLSPSKTIYQHLIPQFRKTPTPNVDLLKERRIWLGENANPGILTRLPQGTTATKRAIVSAPKDDAKHPRKMVLNAFLRRGAPERSTQGNLYRYYPGIGLRPGMKPAEVFGFFDKVKAYD